ncbi:hypothetical protein GDO81_010875 [Engystomops pustulosus]|uniref:Uncharacterized protein n=1 Tax=Engystomops pustulosus TaxID=76066 RepID=A0AAV7C411_ENGPU|nr:hypothetical protein GDO81_010875 [Engystomops pustulosus]
MKYLDQKLCITEHEFFPFYCTRPKTVQINLWDCRISSTPTTASGEQALAKISIANVHGSDPWIFGLGKSAAYSLVRRC